MTKIQKSKKTIASLLAGILLCQVSAFGVSQTSVNAENPARKMSFEVVGEGSVTVTDVEDCIRTVQSGVRIIRLLRHIQGRNAPINTPSLQ